jgi:aldose 1-epimerase
MRIDRLTDGDLEVEVLPELGARLHRVRAFGTDILRTPPDPADHRADPFFWGGYVMAPWCNRVEPHAMEVGGRRVELGVNFRDGTAIHGQVYVAPWSDTGDGAYEIRAGGDGWPWPYEVGARYTVADATLRWELSVTNLADEPMPAGIGIHPWFLRPIEVAIRAASVYPSNMATEAHPEPVEGTLDLRTLAPMPDDLDGCWTDLEDPAVVVRWPAAGLTMRMHAGTTSPVIVAASPSDVDAVAIEPETHAPQAIRRLHGAEPLGLEWLAPGASLVLDSSLVFERALTG